MNITSKIKLMISTLSILIIVVIGVTVYLNYKTQKESSVINIIGKQRMLTQKATKEILLNNAKERVKFDELEEAISEFDNSLNDLIMGNKQRGIYPARNEEIKNNLITIKTNWKDFEKDIEKYKLNKQYSISNKSNIFTNNQLLLDKSELIVQEMVKLNLSPQDIDRSGKQRMLTQKMAFHLSAFINNPNSGDFKNFYSALDSFEKMLIIFSNDSQMNSHQQLKQKIVETLVVFNIFKKSSYNFMDNELLLQKNLENILTKNVTLLNDIDEVVSKYTFISNENREFLQIFQYISLSIATILIIYFFALVLDIQRLFTKFIEHSKDISSIITPSQPVMFTIDEPKDELSIASKHIDNFALHINEIINEANKALEESKNAIEKLADISQNQQNINGIESKELEKILDKSENIAIQSLEDLTITSNTLKKLQNNFLIFSDFNNISSIK